MAARSSAQASAGTARSSRSSASFDTEQRWQLLEEGLSLIRELWAGRSGRARSPIWIGGNSARARRLAAAYDGWLPDSTTLDEMRMSPEDIRDESQEEIAVMGYSAPGEQALHDAYAAAGTTWWLEHLHDRRGTLDDLLARVRAGPSANRRSASARR